MAKTLGIQLAIPGTEFDEWDQRGDETDDEYAARMERARLDAELYEFDPTRELEAKGHDVFECICGKGSLISDMPKNSEGYRLCPHCGASGLQLIGKTAPETTYSWSEPQSSPLMDILEAQEMLARRGLPLGMDCQPATLQELLEEEGLPQVHILDGLPDNTMIAVADQGPNEEPVVVKIELGENYPEPTVNPENPPPTVTLCDVPTTAQTIEALQEMAAKALEKIEQEKVEKRRAQAQAEASVHFEQEPFVEVDRSCVNAGGNGLDCMMCTSEACRYCGYGCWAPEKLNCLHEADERHSWDPEIMDARRAEMEADLRKLEMTEERRQEMLRKIFDGEPSRANVIYCFVCHQEVKDGEMLYVTGRGSRHTRDCGTQEDSH